jgi:DNA-binding protein H-NS
MAKLADLLAQKAALDKKIAEARRAERAEAIEQVRTLMARYGLTLADLSPGRRAGRVAVTTDAPPPSIPKPAKSPGRKGKPLGKVAPKYRDPQTGSTWSGRGLKPRWLTAALAAGHSLEAFRIDGPVDAAASSPPSTAVPGAPGPDAP